MQVDSPERILPASVSPVISDGHSIQASKEESNRFEIISGDDNELRDLPSYTIRLEEYRKREGLQPLYEWEETRLYPRRYISRVTFGDLKAVGGERSSKKDAKHEASKAMWTLLTSGAKVS